MNRTEFIGTDLYYSQDFVDDKNKEIERLNNIIKEARKIYQILCFSAPERDYIFIEQLGEILDKENKICEVDTMN